jgi:DNA-binding NtrC family response regulator
MRMTQRPEQRLRGPTATEHEVILALGCDEGAIDMMTGCLESRGVDVSVVASPAELVREVVSRMPVAIVIGVRPDAAVGLDSIEMVHAVNGKLPVVVIANADSIELERRARETRIFYYLVEPLQLEELDAVVGDVLRYASGC